MKEFLELKLKNFTDKELFRFWNKILKSTPDQCWIWTGYVKRSSNGYILPFFTVNRKDFRHDYPASRISYLLHYKQDPGNLCVLHSCDEYLCCNPYHLFLGTYKENIADSIAKGRRANMKEILPKQKLQLEYIQKIRDMLFHGMTQKEIATKFAVCQQTISKIATGEYWNHI